MSHYRILDALGQGGMGVVYLAEDTHLARRVAVKFPGSHDDEQYRERFLREARAASKLNHPHIAAIYDYGESEEDGNPFLVMELVEGEDLRRALERGPMAPARAVEIGMAVAGALAEAHRHGIVHRDIKPSNIVLGARGEVKVLDFGLAKAFAFQPAGRDGEERAETLSQSRVGVVMGTPAYMSPEQLRGEPLGPASDLFALGAVLYECLGGTKAFTGQSSVEILAAVLHVEPPAPSELNPRVTPEINRVVLKALAKRRTDRYQDAEEILADLRAIAETLRGREAEATVALQAAPNATVAAGWLRSALGRRARPIVAAAMVLMAAIGGWWLVAGRPYQPVPQAGRFYQDGLSSLRDGTYFKASKELAEAARLDPKLGMVHVHLAEAALELEDARTAGEEFAKAGTPERTTRLTRADRDVRDAIGLTLAGRYGDAVNLYRDMVERTPSAAKADALVDLGRAYERAQQPEDALRRYQQAIELDPEQPAAWLRLGAQYGTRKLDAAHANPAFDKAEAIYRSMSNQEGIAEVEYQRGVTAYKLGQITQARALLEKALELAKTAESPSQQILVLMELSLLETSASNAAEAQADASKAIELAHANGIENLSTRGLINLGGAFLGKGEASQGRPYFEQALVLARHYGSERSEFSALLSLGSVETQLGEFDRGLADVRQALAWYQQRGYQKETMQGLTLLSRIEREKGDYSGAMASLRQELDLANRQGNQSQVALSEEGMGNVLLAQGRLSESLKSYGAEVQAAAQSGVTVYEQVGLVDCADVLWRLGQYQGVQPLLNRVGANRSKTVDALIARLQAKMALSRGEFARAGDAARRALAAGVDSDGQRAEWNGILAEADAGLGSRVQAVHAAELGRQLADRAGNPRRVAEIELVQSEAALAMGEWPRAVENAKSAAAWAAGAGNTEMEWRCWWLAARAAAEAGRKSEAHELAERASDLLAGLAQKWDPEDFRTYLTRPDVELASHQLAGLGVQ
ncbi:MAG: protein kinase [Bryobacteraceae bacterium]